MKKIRTKKRNEWEKAARVLPLFSLTLIVLLSEKWMMVRLYSASLLMVTVDCSRVLASHRDIAGIVGQLATRRWLVKPGKTEKVTGTKAQIAFCRDCVLLKMLIVFFLIKQVFLFFFFYLYLFDFFLLSISNGLDRSSNHCHRILSSNRYFLKLLFPFWNDKYILRFS